MAICMVTCAPSPTVLNRDRADVAHRTDTVWQLLYFHFVIQLRAAKIKEGRATSFTFMVNDKKRLIGKIAAKVAPQWREAAFMVRSPFTPPALSVRG
jgi:hypothetical protein